MLYRTAYLPLFFCALLSINCKKSVSRSSEKYITGFSLLTSNNPGLPGNSVGRIAGDSIILTVDQGTSLTSLVPSISYVGASISPNQANPQNFNNPLTYTVTAADGTSATYYVATRILADAKAITSFTLAAADNPGLSADVTGIIVGDTILLYAGVTGDSLIPRITFTGTSVSPASGVKQDFSVPVSYTVTAQDGTRRNYTVILSRDRALYVGSDDGNLYALDAATGSLLWKFGTVGAIRSSPTVWNGMVYFVSEDQTIYAVNATDGSLSWKFYGDYAMGVGGLTTDYSSSPTIQSGILYCNYANVLLALDAVSGSVKWTDNVAFYCAANSPTVANGVLYSSFFNAYQGPVTAFDPSSGNLLREFVGGIGRGNPAVVNGIVYAPNEVDLLDAWDAGTDSLLFRLYVQTSQFYAGPGTSATVYNGNVYVGGGAGLFALDAVTGVTKWSQTSWYSLSASTPTAGDNLIFSFSFEWLHALDASTGAEKWSIPDPTGTLYNASLGSTYANGTLYFGALDGSVTAVNASTGAKKWTFVTKGQVLSSPCIEDVNGDFHHPTVSGDQQ